MASPNADSYAAQVVSAFFAQFWETSLVCWAVPCHSLYVQTCSYACAPIASRKAGDCLANGTKTVPRCSCVKFHAAARSTPNICSMPWRPAGAESALSLVQRANASLRKAIIVRKFACIRCSDCWPRCNSSRSGWNWYMVQPTIRPNNWNNSSAVPSGEFVSLAKAHFMRQRRRRKVGNHE